MSSRWWSCQSCLKLPFSNECKAPKIPTISIWVTYHASLWKLAFTLSNKLSFPFCDFTWLPLKSPSPIYAWRTLMKFRDALNFFIGMVFVIISIGFFCTDFDQTNNLFYYNPLTYHMIHHIDALCLLVIHVILSEIYHTLTVAVVLNWILYDSKYAD